MSSVLQWPPVIFHRRLVSLGIGASILFIGAVGWLVSGDRPLLFLSAALFLFSSLRGLFLFRTISHQKYEIVCGICTQISTRPMQHSLQVTFIDVQGEHHTLLLDCRPRLRVGGYYRIYFKSSRPLTDDKSAAFIADTLLGFEELDPPDSGDNTKKP